MSDTETLLGGLGGKTETSVSSYFKTRCLQTHQYIIKGKSFVRSKPGIVRGGYLWW